MTPELRNILKAIGEDLILAAREVMASDVGVNNKVGFNTLVDSDLYNHIAVRVFDSGDNVTIKMMFNYYLGYIEWNRPKKYGSMPPEDVIIDWLKRKHIVSSTENIKQIKSIAYAVRYSIWRDGHKARKVLDMFEKYVNGGFDEKYLTMLVDNILKDIDDYFSD